jgi:hypothetical protein
MRLGSYPAMLTPGSLVEQAYGSTPVSERHRHRYEVNNAYRDALTRAGLAISATSPDGRSTGRYRCGSGATEPEQKGPRWSVRSSGSSTRNQRAQCG